MITHTINGREYRVREFWSYGAARKLGKAETEEAKSDVMLLELVLDKDGNKYESVEALYDSIALHDVGPLLDVLMPLLEEGDKPDPLPEKSASDAG